MGRAAFLLALLCATPANADTAIRDVPFAAYGEALLEYSCRDSECVFAGDIKGKSFTVSLDHAFVVGSTGCTLSLPGMTLADVACRQLGQRRGDYIEAQQILGTACHAKGVLWSTVVATSEWEPVVHVVKVELELDIAPGQAECEEGFWQETRYYLVCGGRPEPGPFFSAANDRVCNAGVEPLTFEAVHWKPEGIDPDDPWYRRLFAQVRTSTRAVRK